MLYPTQAYHALHPSSMQPSNNHLTAVVFLIPLCEGQEQSRLAD